MNPQIPPQMSYSTPMGNYQNVGNLPIKNYQTGTTMAYPNPNMVVPTNPQQPMGINYTNANVPAQYSK
jgi:hypothetical protein